MRRNENRMTGSPVERDELTIKGIFRALGVGLGCWTCLYASAAYATGVDAGTLIQNTATATYTAGSVTGSVQSNTVTLRVDELLDVAVAGLTSTPAVIGSGNVALAYRITNTGNGPETFNLTADPAVAGNNFDAAVTQIVIDDGDGVYEPGIDQVLTSGAATPVIPADVSLTVFVIVALPPTATDGQTSQVRLTAAATTGTGAPGTVFAGQGTGGGDAVTGSSGADDSAMDSLIASLAAVTLSKSATIVDAFGGNRPLPGATVTFTLTAAVAGTGQVQNLEIADTIPAGTTYQAGTLKLDGITLTDAADTDGGTGGSSGVAVTLPTVSGGTTKVVTFDVKIN